MRDKLSSDKIGSGLDTRLIGSQIYCFNFVRSTNDTAYRLAENGAKEGTVIFSEGQSRGRGSKGRRWVSPKGKGIWMSVVLRPRILPNEITRMYIIVSLAVAEAIKKAANLKARVKWPNDILVGGKKIGGILIERPDRQPAPEFIIAGIGIDVNVSKNSFPAYVRWKATSVKEELKRETSRITLAREILRKIDEYYVRFKNVPVEFKWGPLSLVAGSPAKIEVRNNSLKIMNPVIKAKDIFRVSLKKGFLECGKQNPGI